MGRPTNIPVPILLVTNWFRTGPLQVLGSTLAGRVIGTRFGRSVSRCLGIFLRPQGAFPTRLLFPSGRFGLSPGAWGTPNKGNADGAIGIFGNTGRVWATALRLVPPKKRPCAIVARKVGRAINTQSRSFWWQIDFELDLSRCWVVLWLAVLWDAVHAECVSVPGDFRRSQGAFLLGYYSLRRGWVNRPAPEAPIIRGMPTGPWAILGNTGRVWATALGPDPPKKGLVPYFPVKWGAQWIPQSRSVWHGSCRVCLGSWRFSFGLRGFSPRLLLLSGRLGLSPCAWRASNKGNADGTVGIFWGKKALCHTCPLAGVCNK